MRRCLSIKTLSPSPNTMQRYSLALLIVAALALPTGGHPVKIWNREVHLPRIPSTHAVSMWTVASHRDHTLMRWTCGPFEPLQSGADSCDATMRLQSFKPRRNRFTRVLRPFDCTDISAGRSEAMVIAKSGKRGVTRMRLTVGIDDRFSAAGKYCTTVNLTVSAL